MTYQRLHRCFWLGNGNTSRARGIGLTAWCIENVGNQPHYPPPAASTTQEFQLTWKRSTGRGAPAVSQPTCEFRGRRSSAQRRRALKHGLSPDCRRSVRAKARLVGVSGALSQVTFAPGVGRVPTRCPGTSAGNREALPCNLTKPDLSADTPAQSSNLQTTTRMPSSLRQPLPANRVP